MLSDCLHFEAQTSYICSFIVVPVVIKFSVSFWLQVLSLAVRDFRMVRTPFVASTTTIFIGLEPEAEPAETTSSTTYTGVDTSSQAADSASQVPFVHQAGVWFYVIWRVEDHPELRGIHIATSSAAWHRLARKLPGGAYTPATCSLRRVNGDILAALDLYSSESVRHGAPSHPTLFRL
jgi:hypothetical protein